MVRRGSVVKSTRLDRPRSVRVMIGWGWSKGGVGRVAICVGVRFRRTSGLRMLVSHCERKHAWGGYLLSSFTSRCTIPFICRYRTAPRSSANSLRINGGVRSSLCSDARSKRSPPGQYGSTSKALDGCMLNAFNCTSDGWSTVFSISSSRFSELSTLSRDAPPAALFSTILTATRHFGSSPRSLSSSEPYSSGAWSM